jgi:hypothetical protein
MRQYERTSQQRSPKHLDLGVPGDALASTMPRRESGPWSSDHWLDGCTQLDINYPVRTVLAELLAGRALSRLTGKGRSELLDKNQSRN